MKSTRLRFDRHSTVLMLLGLMVPAFPSRAAATDAQGGERIYRRQCASCHGTAGEGSEECPRPLAGDKSVPQLARYIARSMPEDDPGTCVGADADQVAAFIHDAFYSKAAQARRTPPRIELSRLTVRQYRNVVADLIGGFRALGRPDEQRGLRGEYFKSRRFQNNERVIDRTDPTVKFDFGDSGPDPEKFDPYEFSIRWEGSVLAPETGDYEFIVRTEHATRLWVNDDNRPLIDARVKSGTDNEYRASLFLLGGRMYPLRLEFSKAKQGVDDSKKNKERPKVKASIALEWKLPHRTAEVVPQHNLSRARLPETFVLTTPFPPDDRNAGYDRGTSISKAWDQATTAAAIEIADYVAAHRSGLTATPDGAPDRTIRFRDFSLKFAERAFRRPLTDEQKQVFIARQFADGRDPEAALTRALLLVLKSPRFLYRELSGGRDPYDVASRISFGLWDSLPDQELLNAAAKGELATREQVGHQAERMVTDLRTKAKLREFFLQWLRVEHASDLSKDPERFPEFNPELLSDLRTSLDLFLEDVIGSGSADFRQLLLADFLYLNGRLAHFYGSDLPADAPFQKVTLEPTERAGVLSHPYLMATFAYTATSSPIHRGVFISRSVLGRSLPPPPVAVAPLAPDLHAGLTTRERVTLQTSPAACTTCHNMINPFGFGLERFDAVGRLRTVEKERPIDASGTYEAPTGALVPFTGARALATVLADSEETHKAFVAQLFHDLVKQPIGAFGPRELPDLCRGFAENGFHMRKLMVAIIAASALTPPEAHP